MHLLALGLNHRTAPLAVREQAAVPAGRLLDALEALRQSVGKGVILSTCNRLELYTVADSPSEGSAALRSFLETFTGLPLALAGEHLYAYSQRQVVRHLFRVACGLDSQILGESQILGQVRDAYGASTRAGMAGGSLSRLFHQALRTGKRARRETDIGRNALSISRAAVELARRTLGDLAGRRVLVVGVGDAGAMAARAVADAGAAEITITNRTLARAQELAAELGGRAEPLDGLSDLLAASDIVITATGAPGYLLTPPLLAQARVAPVRSALAGSLTADHPLFIIDIAVPRDVDPEVRAMSGIHLFDLEDLETVAEMNRRQRQAEARKAEAIVLEEVDAFMDWVRSLEVLPTVAGIHKGADALRKQELERALRRLPALSEADRATLEAFSKALVKKLLHNPIATLKQRRDPYYTQAAHDLFSPEDEG